jgi:hypothetical protein
MAVHKCATSACQPHVHEVDHARLTKSSRPGPPGGETSVNNLGIAIGHDCVPRTVRPGEAIITMLWKNKSPHLGASFSSLDERHFCAMGASTGGTYRFAVPPAGRGFALYAHLPHGKWVLYENRYRCEPGGRLTITLETRLRSDGALAFKASYDPIERCSGEQELTPSAHAILDRSSGDDGTATRRSMLLREGRISSRKDDPRRFRPAHTRTGDNAQRTRCLTSSNRHAKSATWPCPRTPPPATPPESRAPPPARRRSQSARRNTSADRRTGPPATSR